MVEPPEGANIVGSRITFHYKTDAEGNIASQKARLVAQGFTQKEGIDYNETFAPTAKLTAIRIVAALAARNDETIYMRLPRGYEVPGKEHLVAKLKKALYGLKQAGR